MGRLMASSRQRAHYVFPSTEAARSVDGDEFAQLSHCYGEATWRRLATSGGFR